MKNLRNKPILPLFYIYITKKVILNNKKSFTKYFAFIWRNLK